MPPVRSYSVVSACSSGLLAGMRSTPPQRWARAMRRAFSGFRVSAASWSRREATVRSCAWVRCSMVRSLSCRSMACASACALLPKSNSALLPTAVPMAWALAPVALASPCAARSSRSLFSTPPSGARNSRFSNSRKAVRASAANWVLAFLSAAACAVTTGSAISLRQRVYSSLRAGMDALTHSGVRTSSCTLCGSGPAGAGVGATALVASPYNASKRPAITHSAATAESCHQSGLETPSAWETAVRWIHWHGR